MIRWMIGTSMRLQFLVVVLALVLIVAGSSQISDMPVDNYPEFDPPLVEVQTEALGLSAAEMEALITVPLEADLLNGVAWLDRITSETVAGLSSILLVFEPGTDPIRARQMVQERLITTFALPNVSTPPTMLQPLSSSSRAMMIGLSSDDLSLIDMSVLARWNIRPRLMGVTGVANVVIWGQREWQLQVQVDPQRLNDEGVTLEEVIRTTGEAMWVSPLSYLEASSPGTAGWIDTPNQRLGIQHLLPISAAADLAKIPVVNHADLELGAIADVVEDHQLLIGDALVSGGPGLILVIEKFPNANILDVTRGVEEALAALQPGLTGIDIDTTIFRPANYIELATDNLTSLVVIGAGLLTLVLVAFYFGWRATIVSLIVIPLSLISAVLVLYLRGATFNAMILAGLVMALGVIVDDAIVDVEHIARRLRQRRSENSEESTFSIIMEAAVELRQPLLFAFLIVLLAVVPVFFLEGLAGTFFQPLTASYALAVIVSLAVALIATPALSLLLLGSQSRKTNESPFMRGLQDSYQRTLRRLINASSQAIIAGLVIVAVGAVAVLIANQSLMPTFKQTDLRVQWDAMPSTSREAMIRVTSLAVDELRAIPGVQNVGSHVGRAIAGDQIGDVNSGEVWINLNPDANYNDTLSAIQETLSSYPGISSTLETYQPDRTNDVLAGDAQEVVVRVYGYDFPVLEETAQNVSQAIASVNGLTDVKSSPIPVEPQIEIEVDLAAAERYRIKPGEVRRAATTLMSGLTVGNLYEHQKIFEVVVWSKPELRDSMTDIREMLVDTPTGQVALGELAEIRIRPAPSVLRRDAVQRYVDVTATLDGRSFDAVSTDIKAALESIEFPVEYHAEILSSAQLRLIGQQDLILVLVIALVGVFLILQAAFESWRLATIAILSLPVALAGSGIAIFLGGGVLSLGSIFGLLTVMGIAIRQSMVLITTIQNQQTGGDTAEPENVVRGATDRVVPILMTTLALAAAIIPILFTGSVAGTEVLYPMTIVILGGLVTNALVNLFILPALYVRFGKGQVSAPQST